MAGPRGLSPDQVARITRGLANDRAWAKELRKAYRPIAKFGADKTRAQMRSGGNRRLAASARAVRPSPTPLGAEIRIGGSTVPFALATVYGTKGRTGWNLFSYTRPSPGQVVGIRALGDTPKQQHPEWVGDDWPIAVRGRGPRGLNDAMAANLDHLGEMFLDAAMAVVIRAFPSGSLT